VQLLENADTEQVGHHPFTEAERRKRDAGTTEETIAIDRLWNNRPDGFAIKQPTEETEGGELGYVRGQGYPVISKKLH
jgi:hypothetical protein